MNPGTTALDSRPRSARPARRSPRRTRRTRCRAPRGAGRRRQESALADAQDALRARVRRARPRHARVPPRLAGLRPRGERRRRPAPERGSHRFSGSSCRRSRRASTFRVRQGDMVLTILSESPAATLHAPGRAGGLTPLGDDLGRPRPRRGPDAGSSSTVWGSRSHAPAIAAVAVAGIRDRAGRVRAGARRCRRADSRRDRRDRRRAQCVRSTLPVRRSARGGRGAPGAWPQPSSLPRSVGSRSPGD